MYIGHGVQKDFSNSISLNRCPVSTAFVQNLIPTDTVVYTCQFLVPFIYFPILLTVIFLFPDRISYS